LTEFHEKRDPLKRTTFDAEGNRLLPDIDIPDEVVERATRLYTLCEAFDWKLAPDVIERQDGALMAAMLEIGSASMLVKALLDKEHEPKRKPEDHHAR
jgi:hypothetical protein